MHDKGYNVNGVYHLLTAVKHNNQDVYCDVVWNKIIPLKVSNFSWRLLKNRSPTKNSCFEESLNHLFLECEVFGETWDLIRHCFGIRFVTPSLLTNHLLQFTSLSGYSRKKKNKLTYAHYMTCFCFSDLERKESTLFYTKG